MHKVVESRDQPWIQSGHMTYVTLGCLLPPDPWVLHWLRSIFLSPIQNTQEKKRIFISREDAAHRRFENEAAFWEFIQKEGFEKIELGNMTIDQQVAIVAHAEAIISPHGAGLTNLVWATEGTRVIELFGYEYISSCYWSICNMLNLPYAFAIGEPILHRAHRYERAVLEEDRLTAPIRFKDPKHLAHKALEFIES